jgi:hypothetical protein
MMNSPIPVRFWNTVFAVTVTSAAALTLWSLWRQNATSRTRFAEQWAIVASAKRNKTDPQVVADTLRAIFNGVLEERKSKKGASILGVHDNAALIVSLLELKENDDQTSVIAVLALELVALCFANEADTRRIFAAAGGYERLIDLMKMANKFCNVSVLDLTAKVFCDATEVSESELVLPGDVPLGCEGSYALATLPGFSKTLRSLDGEARLKFLQSMSGGLSNIALLRVGARCLSQGVDNCSGLEYFRRLLSHRDSLVVANSVRAIGSLIMHCPEDASLCVQGDNLQPIIDLIDIGRSPKVVEGAMRVLHYLSLSGSKDTFLIAVRDHDAVTALCSVWVSTMEREVRFKAELLVRRFGADEITAQAVLDALLVFKPRINERQKRDKEEEEREREKEKRQAYMQHMMMQQMMGGGGMPPQLAQMMEDE